MKKYDQLRGTIKNGDIVIFREKSLIAKLIILSDKSYYSHIGLVFKSNGRLFIIDSNSQGVNPKFLSGVVKKSSDFCVLRPEAWGESTISRSLGEVLDRAQNRKIKYDFGLIIQIAIQRFFGKKIDFDNEQRDICSEFTRRFIRNLNNPESRCFEQPNIPTNYITPWDFVLYADGNFSLLYDDSERSKYRKKLVRE